MTRPLVRIAALFLAFLFILLINVNYITVVQGPELRRQPGNSRVLLDEYSRERGAILVGGRPVARSVTTDGRFRYLRQYTDGTLYAPVTGFYSLIYGATGIERGEGELLAGSTDLLFGRRLVDLFTGREPRGGSVVLTIDPRAQAAAAEALGNRRGAAVAIDPATGAILAMVTSPSYDPNLLSSHNTDTIRATYESLNGNAQQPLLNRGLARTYPPGSLFKVVTAAAALESGLYTPASMLRSPARLDLPGTTADLPNYDGKACGNGTTSLTDALRVSCNTAFGSLGLALGENAIAQMSARFGFETSFAVPMVAARSRFPVNLNQPQLAQSAIGQFDVRATPLQMAMVAAAIANQGRLMRPYLVAERLSPELTVISQTEPLEISRAMSPQNAAALTAMMVTVVRSGTGRAAAIPGVDVAGKTGTAQQGRGRPPHAWFMAFAPAASPRIAIAVVVEDGGDLGSEATGGRLAAPVAKAVITAVLGPPR
jgi:penicillin-binding protein A